MEEGDEDLFIPLASCLNTAVGVTKLLRNDTHTENESYMLMRSLLEKLVNFHYLKVSGEVERERYKLHPFYKVYHNTMRDYATDNTAVRLEWNGDRNSMRAVPEIRRALTLFSDSNSRMDWTRKTFRQRVNRVVNAGSVRAGILEISALLSYGDASEVLHGSMYGQMILTGMWELGNYRTGEVTSEEVGRHVSMRLALQLCLLGKLMLDTARLINHRNLENITSQADEYDRSIHELLVYVDSRD